MMKKYFLLFLLFVPVLSGAKVVPVSQAQRQAEAFFQAAPSTKASGGRVHLAWSGMPMVPGADPALHLFVREGGGFVLIAGDDVSGPVLGYSLDGQFPDGDLPSNVRWWFSEIVAGMQRAKAAGVSGRQILSTKASGGVLLQTPHWSQRDPYNRLTPNGCLTGCVATAMAELIGYYKYPVEPIGVIPSYTFKMDEEKEYTIPETDLAGRHYNFDLMDGDMISQLMVDCGYAVKMTYGHKASSASSFSVKGALVTYFKYTEHCALLEGDYYSSRDWLSLLRKEIDEGSPVYYSARSPEEGHAFLIDGYDADGNVHINFGWGGKSDGYFVFPDLGDYNMNHNALIGLRPVSGGEPYIVWGIKKYKDGDKGLKCSTSSFLPMDSFQVSYVGDLCNFGSGLLDGSVFVAQVNASGAFIRPVSGRVPVQANRYYMYYASDNPLVLDCVLTADYDEGDRLVLYYQLTGEDTPMPVVANDEVAHFATYIPIVDGIPQLGSLSNLTFDKENGVISFRTAEYVQITFISESGNTYPEAMTTLSPGNLEINTKALPQGNYKLSLRAGTRSKTLEITL